MHRFAGDVSKFSRVKKMSRNKYRSTRKKMGIVLQEINKGRSTKRNKSRSIRNKYWLIYQK
jgi:hypothetical protein